ncbi:MAG: hypothetical protein A3F41_06390 [Coxiella sp. RIFCSPHIGHO2_12_FULL_44_14]|nr:MAG: hypothetical protein A3F41_06390 [Coxiella sp. RIFCSPHIGHO2_12_FULL_44_14]
MNTASREVSHFSRYHKKMNPFVLWIMHHTQACLYSLRELSQAPLSNLMTITVIAVAMALPAGFYVLLKNFQSISQPWSADPSISLYLNHHAPQEEILALTEKLKKQNNIKSVRYISPQEGLREFVKATQLNNILSILQSNPLPPVLVVTPTVLHPSPYELKQLLNQFKKLPTVHSAEIDIAWVQRLYYLIEIGQRMTYALALLFGIGVILIVWNTIRLTTQNHHQEIIVYRLVGATPAFIRRPLLYRGFIYGLSGGCLAWLLVALLLWWLRHPVEYLARSYGSVFTIQGLDVGTGLAILLISAVLGLIGSWVAVQKYLTAHESL